MLKYVFFAIFSFSLNANATASAEINDIIRLAVPAAVPLAFKVNSALDFDQPCMVSNLDPLKVIAYTGDYNDAYLVQNLNVHHSDVTCRFLHISKNLDTIAVVKNMDDFNRTSEFIRERQEAFRRSLQIRTQNRLEDQNLELLKGMGFVSP